MSETPRRRWFQSLRDPRHPSPLLLGIASLWAFLIWGNCMFSYISALPVVLLGSAMSVWGAAIAIQRLSASGKGSRFALATGLVVCFLGLLANIGLFAVALIDM
jgi:hypothetical protein